MVKKITLVSLAMVLSFAGSPVFSVDSVEAELASLGGKQVSRPVRAGFLPVLAAVGAFLGVASQAGSAIHQGTMNAIEEDKARAQVDTVKLQNRGLDIQNTQSIRNGILAEAQSWQNVNVNGWAALQALASNAMTKGLVFDQTIAYRDIVTVPNQHIQIGLGKYSY